MNSPKKRLLILCTANSARSQMAEALVRHHLGDRWEVHSAGSLPARHLHPMAIRVMAELGIDISSQHPKPLSLYLNQPWDLVITVCDQAKESCPNFPATAQKLHLSLPDPAAAKGTEEEKLAAFRTVRNSLQNQLLPLLEKME